MSLDEFMTEKTNLDMHYLIGEAAKFDYSRSLRRTFENEAKVLFLDYENLLSFSWDQATDSELDYEFFVNRLGIKVNSVSKSLHISPFPNTDINEFMDLFSDEELKSLFGDHVTVTVCRDGISVKYFDNRYGYDYKAKSK